MSPPRSERTLQRGRLAFEVDHGLKLQWIVDGATEEIVLPYPNAGFGGHELVVSPDEDYVALFVFSGQSQQGWELFALAPQLRHVGGLPYVLGEGDAPQFSPDGQWLAMLVAIAPRVRDTGAYFESVSDTDASDSLVVDWARLYVQRVPEPEIASYGVGAELPRSLDPDETAEWTAYDALRFTTASTLELTTPWHERITCALPATELPIATYAPA